MRLYLKACRTTYAASTLKTLLCAALALVMAGLPACGALAFTMPVLVVAAVVIVMYFVVNRKLRNVDMLEALKSVD